MPQKQQPRRRAAAAPKQPTQRQKTAQLAAMSLALTRAAMAQRAAQTQRAAGAAPVRVPSAATPQRMVLSRTKTKPVAGLLGG
jgi:hypothetical protein